MNAKQLRESILQYAMQGKLVQQEPNDEPASELIKRIKVEKELLIVQKVIKKEKALPEITEEEIPFGIPESWEWVRASEILDIRDGTHDTPKYVTEGIPLVTSKNLKEGNLVFEPIKYISEEDHLNIEKRSKVDTDDILFAMIGSIGNPVLVKKDRDFSVKNVGIFKALPLNKMNMQYVFLYLSYIESYLKKEASGGVQSFVSLSKLRQLLLPVPPLEEQKRIVEAVYSLEQKISQYNSLHDELERINQNFPVQLEKSILQYAMQGKLVEQQETDEPANLLVKQIKAEKERLVKEKIIKKEKALPEITEEEIPFEIPGSWEWVRIGEISYSISAGGDKPKDFSKEKNGEYTIPVIANGKKNKGIIGYTNSAKAEEGSLTVSGRGTIGYACVRSEPFYPVVRLIVIKPSHYLCIEYLQLVLEALIEKGVGTSIPQLTVPMIYPKLIPLPPVKEQRRIVNRVNKLIGINNKLLNRD